MRNQIALLQEQVANANQAYVQLSAANNNGNNFMRAAKPEKFDGDNIRSWIKSINNIIESQNTPPTEEQKSEYAVSYSAGDGLQWWELT